MKSRNRDIRHPYQFAQAMEVVIDSMVNAFSPDRPSTSQGLFVQMPTIIDALQIAVVVSSNADLMDRVSGGMESPKLREPSRKDS